VTVTHLDALVLARSGFHHSVNYRSVMAFAAAHVVEGIRKAPCHGGFGGPVLSGRAALLRAPNACEFKATAL